MGLFSAASDIAGSLTGGLVGSSPTEDYANQVAALSKKYGKKVRKEASKAYGDITDMISPYVEAGTQALEEYRKRLDEDPTAPMFDDFEFDFADFENTPFFQFMQRQQAQELDRLAAKNKALTSGNRMLDAMKYGTDLSSTLYGDEWERQFRGKGYNDQLAQQEYMNQQNQFLNQMQRLGGLTGMGETATGRQIGARSDKADAYTRSFGLQGSNEIAASSLPATEQNQFVQNAARNILGGLFGMG